jgi:hypothetical protein
MKEQQQALLAAEEKLRQSKKARASAADGQVEYV